MTDKVNDLKKITTQVNQNKVSRHINPCRLPVVFRTSRGEVANEKTAFELAQDGLTSMDDS